MFIKSLKVETKDSIIREIKFHKGLNLIVDKTQEFGIMNENEMKKTGNSVGKTTVIKLIDFCLGADPKIIYTDPENPKHQIEVVSNYLVENGVIITLVLKEDLDVDDSKETTIRRNFLNKKSKVMEVDGVQYLKRSGEEFEEKIRDILFPDLKLRKPTLRELLSHNIRYKDIQINNTLKCLDAFTSGLEYETLHLYMFGCTFDNGTLKMQLNEKLKNENSYLRKLILSSRTKSELEALLGNYNYEIEQYTTKIEHFNINENYLVDLDTLDSVKGLINDMGENIARLKNRKSIILNAREELESEIFKDDLTHLKEIYDIAANNISGIQKSFEDLVHFHNGMIKERSKFVSKELPRIEENLESSIGRLEQLFREEKELSVRLRKSGTLEELEKVIKTQSEKFIRVGEIQNQLTLIDEAEKRKREISEKINELNKEILDDSFQAKVQERINDFNRYFSDISNKLYGESYLIKVEPKLNKEKKEYYSFDSFNDNSSTGKKQGEILCFDIAYINFAEDYNVNHVNFMLNDKKELLHGNQLAHVQQVIEGMSNQLIIPILNDKLPLSLKNPQYVVLELSQTKKLFLIENNHYEKQ